MRQFTFVSGTSSKFWEVSRSEMQVMVRFGRIGTNGQTQVKDLEDESAAEAHVDKLVREKTAKGYVEEAVAPRPVPVAAAVATPPAKTITLVTMEEPAPADEAAPAVNAVARPASAARVVEPADEDHWEVPASWWGRTEPFRGLGPPKPVPLDPEARAMVASMTIDAGTVLARALDHPQTDSTLRGAARLYLGHERNLFGTARQESTPLGAAVVASVVVTFMRGRSWIDIAAFADAWVSEHGASFAVQAAMQFSAIAVCDLRNSYHGANDLAIFFRDGSDQGWDDALLGRLRVILAGLEDDAAYAEAVAAAAVVRMGGIAHRLASSYLLPTEQTWVTQDIDEVVVPGQCIMNSPVRLFASVTTPQQAAKLEDLNEHGLYYLNRTPELIWSVVAHVGPAMAPLLSKLYDGYGVSANRKRPLSILAQLPTDEAFQLMVDRLGQKFVASALLEAMNLFPNRAMRLLATAVSKGKGGPAKELLRGHIIDYPDLVQPTQALLPQVAHMLEDIARSVDPVERTSDDQVPPVLASPPWRNRKPKTKTVVVEGLATSAVPRLAWKPDEKAKWRSLPIGWDGRQAGTAWPEHLANMTRPGDSFWQVEALAGGPEELVRPLLRRPDLMPPFVYDAQDALKVILAKYGEESTPYVTRVAIRSGTPLAPVLQPVTGPDVALAMAHWYARSKSLRQLTLSWFARHPEAAARDLIPFALGKPGKDRAAAEAALRRLDPNIVRAAAAAYGSDAAAGVSAVLELDPLHQLPARMPTVPAWLEPGHLPPILVADRSGALPVEAAANVVLMLMLCRPGETYAGIALVKEACELASLTQFAWAIFERWRAADYSAKDGWVLEGLGLFGDDDVVRELATLIRAWPGESARARAIAALDVLSASGTDVALMHLHRISEKVTFKSVQTKAQEKLAQVAEERRLTPEQLADRLVPDLGLADRGTTVLDYGSRSFTVGFDEQLKPIVLDPDGSRRKVLPKPSAKDDQVLAKAAYAQFGGLKKDVKTIAQDQIRRLERAMVAGRRWSAEEYRQLFIEHPLVWHLARRLVWATFDGEGQLLSSFRVAEDRSLADSADDETTIAGDAVVGIAHPLHLGEVEIGAWSETLADYEILQPFAQLGRETFALTDAERKSATLDRFQNVVAPTGRLLGMSHRGWQRGAPMDAGMTGEVFRDIGDGRYVTIDFDPGIAAFDVMEFPEQELVKVWLSQGMPGWGSSQGTDLFEALDEITASEILRDLEALVSPS